MKWALVPLMPKELTPTSGGSAKGQGSSSRWTSIGTSAQGIAGFGVSKWS